MEAGEHKLAIFRGLLKFKSNQQKIWGVLIFLSIVTTIEVVLGILKPQILVNITYRLCKYFKSYTLTFPFYIIFYLIHYIVCCVL